MRCTPAVSLANQQSLLALADDLAASPFKPLGEGLRIAAAAYEWFPEGHPPLCGRQAAAAAEAAAGTAAVFMTARQHEEQAVGRQQQAAEPVLGQKVDISAFFVDATGTDLGRQRRKQYTLVPPALQARWDSAKRVHAEADGPTKTVTAGAPIAPVAAGASTAAAAGTSRPQPPALSRAAAAAAGTQKPGIPTFKRIGAAIQSTAGGQKRAGGAKAGVKPAAPKRPRAAAAAAASAAASAVPVPAGGSTA